jgi:hypothetical protein
LRSYELKKHSIGHSIYGVDLDPSAIDIARLRLWLSLVVDEDDYTSIDALPNLDYKIMQGNSLIEEYEGVKLFDEAFIQEEDHSLESEKKAIQEQLLEIQREYVQNLQLGDSFDVRLSELDQQLKELNTKLKSLQKKERNRSKDKVKQAPDMFDLIGEARKKASQLEDLHQRFFTVSSPAEKRRLRDEITRIEWELIEATLTEQGKKSALSKLAEYKNSGEKPWFLWKLNFSEVFKQKGGFDVVIGNPPYVQIQAFSGQQIQKDLEAQKYETFSKTGDLYCLFYERGQRILKDQAVLCFITSNKWMRAKYGEKTRQFLAEKATIRQLIDFGDSPIFSEATTYTNILLFEKSKRDAELQVWDMANCYQKQTSLLSILEQQGEGSASFDSSSYIVVSAEMALIKKRIEEVGTPLKDWKVSINYGIKTGFNEAFIINGKKKEELIAADPKSAEIIKPILRGRDIKRYRAEFADLWLINSHNGYGNIAPISIENYPSIKAHLDQYQTQLTKRQDKGVTPYNLRNCAYLPEFEKEKIVFAEIVYDSAFCFDCSGVHPEATTFVLTGESPEFLTALLNSRLLTFAFKSFYAGGDLRGDTFRYKKVFLQNLPIIRPQGIIKNAVESFVDFIQLLHVAKRSLQASYFEQLIDGLVYELYFPEEIEAAGKEILPHLGELKQLEDTMSDEEKLAVINEEFKRLYDPTHPVRNHLETLDSVEVVRIIQEALKK